MGYTHYWRIKRDAKGDERNTILTYANAVLLEHADIVAGPNGTGEPIVNARGILLNGKGSRRYETFNLGFKKEKFAFCKTGRMPYDIVVVALLTIATRVAPSAYSMSSDGNENDLSPGRWLAAKVMGDERVLGRAKSARWP